MPNFDSSDSLAQIVRLALHHAADVGHQQRLSMRDALNEYIVHTGSAVFAVPPGVRLAARSATAPLLELTDRLQVVDRVGEGEAKAVPHTHRRQRRVLLVRR